MSSQTSGRTVILHAITEGLAAARSGVAQEESLLAFAEALVSNNEGMLAPARARLLDELGAESLVDAAAVASNFERMVRIADSTGIPLDGPIDEATAGMRTELNLARFESTASMP